MITDPEPLDIDSEVLEGLAVIMIGMTVIFAAAYGALLWFTGRRSNWARWALLAFVVSTTLISAGDLPRSLSETPVAVIVDGCITLAEVWAFRLLFFGPGAQWFS